MQASLSGMASAISAQMASMRASISASMAGVTVTITTSMLRMRTAMQSGMTASRTVVTTGMTAIRVAATTGMTAMVMVVRTSFTQITTTATTQMNAVQRSVTVSLVAIRNEFTAVNTMKSAMHFSWSLPHLKVPHISVSGSFSIDPPSAPKFSVSWYKEGGILNGAQIFGMAGGTLLGGGEAGQEAVLPLSELWSQMRTIMADVVSRTDSNAGLSALADRLDALTAGDGGKTLADLADLLTGSKGDGEPRPGGGDAPIYQITYSPTFQFYGEAPSQEDMTEAARMSQDEFNDMMDEWVKTNNRKNF